MAKKPTGRVKATVRKATGAPKKAAAATTKAATTNAATTKAATTKAAKTKAETKKTAPSDAVALKEALGPSMARAKARISAMMKAKPLNARFTDATLSALITHHPTRKYSEPVLGFVKAKRPPYNRSCLHVVLETAAGFTNTVDVSWIKCVQNLYGKHNKATEARRLVIGAFRNGAFAGKKMKSARERFTVGPCSDCGKRCKLAIDHAGKPFAQILDDFLAQRALSLDTVPTLYHSGARVLASSALEAEWVAHHDAQCELVGLCRSCNSSKGSGGYRHCV